MEEYKKSYNVRKQHMDNLYEEVKKIKNLNFK